MREVANGSARNFHGVSFPFLAAKIGSVARARSLGSAGVSESRASGKLAALTLSRFSASRSSVFRRRRNRPAHCALHTPAPRKPSPRRRDLSVVRGGQRRRVRPSYSSNGASATRSLDCSSTLRSSPPTTSGAPVASASFHERLRRWTREGRLPYAPSFRRPPSRGRDTRAAAAVTYTVAIAYARSRVLGVAGSRWAKGPRVRSTCTRTWCVRVVCACERYGSNGRCCESSPRRGGLAT